ncbi:MAG TPA: MFS transporter [Candidatus Dormibacteraeota bacterium]|nr:MFS transporter [Candidatus Dormibacteraeota bacterium]
MKVAAPSNSEGGRPVEGGHRARSLVDSVLDAPRGRLTLATLALGSFLGMADASVVSVALARIGARLGGGSLADAQYILSLYLIVLVATLPLAGRVADGIGRRRAFGVGFAVFGLGSLGCALAPSFAVLLVGRSVAAVGGAFLSAQSLALVTLYARPSHRTRAIAVLVVVQALAGLLGPPIGGLLVGTAGWRAVFWVAVPIAAVGVLGTWGVLRSVSTIGERANGRTVVDALLLAAVLGAAAAGVTGLAASAALGWPPALWGALALAAEVVRRWRRGRTGAGRGHEIGPVRAGLLAAGLSTGTLMSLFAVLPFWLQRVQGFSPLASGLVFLPVAVGLGLSSPWAGRRADRQPTSVRTLTLVGAVLGAVSLIVLAVTAVDFSLPILCVALFVLGVGNGGFGTLTSSAVMGAAARARLGEAGARLAVARNGGVIVGLSVSGAVYTRLATHNGVASQQASPELAPVVIFGASAALLLTAGMLAWRTGGGVSSARPLDLADGEFTAVPVP